MMVFATMQKGEPMALNNLEDRLECAIRHINTALDIDPWAQNLAVESMRMRIALMKGGQPEIIRCRDCRWRKDQSGSTAWLPCRAIATPSDFYCGRAERKTDEQTDER